MKKLALLIILILVSNFVRAQDWDFSVKTDSITVQPGERIKVVLIARGLPQPDTLSLSDSLLPGWKILSETRKIPVRENGVCILILNVMVPSRALSDNYQLKFWMSSNLNTAQYSVQPIFINVSERHNIEVRLIDVPDLIMSKTEAEVTFEIKNLGNVDEKLELRGFQCNVKGARVVSVPKDSIVFVRAMVKTDLNNRDAVKYTISLDAFNKYLKVNGHRTIEMLPASEKAIDPYKRYSVRSNVRYIGRYFNGSYEDGYQFSVSGSGELKKEGHYLDFVFQGPDKNALSVNRTFNQYSVAYSAPKFYINAGHKSYSVSRLIESSRSGFGGQVGYKTKHINISGFYVKPRFYPEITDEYGLIVKGYVGKTAEFGLNYVQKKLALLPYDANLVSVSYKSKNLKKFRLNSEVSYGIQGSQTGYGINVGISQSISSVNYYLSGLYTSEDYPGYYRNSLIANGSLSFNSKNVNSSFTGAFSRANPLNDTTYIAAPYSWNLIWNNRFYYNHKKSNVEIRFGTRAREDRFIDKNFNYTEYFGRTILNNKWNRWQWSLTGEYAYTLNYREPYNGVPSNSYRGISYLKYEHNQGANIYLDVRYINDVVYSNDKLENWVFATGGNLVLGRSTRIFGRYQSNFGIEEMYLNRNVLQLGLRQRLGENHELEISTNSSLLQGTESTTDFGFYFDYTYIAGIPIAKLYKVGSLKGKLVGNDGVNVKGVAVNFAGRSAVTDKNGDFEFNNVKPGKHYLLFNRASFHDLKDIPAIKVPMEIEIIEDIEHEITIPITKAGRVEGKIVLQKARKTKGVITNEVEFPRYVVIHIENELGQVQRTTSLSSGEFVLTDLKPGNWKLFVSRNGLDKNIVIVNPLVKIEVLPAQTKEVTILLKPKERNIKFKNNKTIKISK